jgi:hypothetical protein
MKGEWIKAERDAIRAQTIEECAEVAYRHSRVTPHDPDRIEKAIRALAKPVAAEKEQT